jgi:hypothetical protein
MATTKKQIMDVTHPGKSAANATSKPVIVGHGSMVQDPMVAPSEQSKVAEQTIDSVSDVGHEGVKVAPPSSSDVASANQGESVPGEGKTAETKDAQSQEPSESTTNQDTENKPDDMVAGDQGVVSAVADGAIKHKSKKDTDTDIGNRTRIEKLIKDKTYAVPIGQVRRRQHRIVGILFLTVMVLIVFFYAAIDAGIIEAPINLPYRFFGT